MAYLAPKTDWTSVDGVLSTDLNRIEGNIENLATLRAYPTATGTGTAITVTTGHFELTAGRSFSFVASANNSGAATTINADGTGAKNLYKPNTTAAPTIISGKAYTVWYNGTSFFVKASAEGDAVAGDVIKDKTFSNDEDNAKTKLTGTMTNNGTASTDISAKATEVTIAQGYHSGSGKVKIATAEQAKIIPGNILEDVDILGVTGTYGKFLAGTNTLALKSALSITNNGIYQKVSEFLINKTGAYRVSFELRNDVSSLESAYGRIYKNGTAVGIERINPSDSFVTYTEDFSFTAGDYCQLYLKTGDYSYYAYSQNFKIAISINYLGNIPTLTL